MSFSARAALSYWAIGMTGTVRFSSCPGLEVIRRRRSPHGRRLRAQRGEVHGIVGENGAGKSTLMKIIAGVHTDFRGTMRLDGAEVRFHSARDAQAAGIGMVYQELSIVRDLSVAENVFLGRQPTGAIGSIAWRRMAREAGDHLRGLESTSIPRRAWARCLSASSNWWN